MPTACYITFGETCFPLSGGATGSRFLREEKTRSLTKTRLSMLLALSPGTASTGIYFAPQLTPGQSDLPDAGVTAPQTKNHYTVPHHLAGEGWRHAAPFRLALRDCQRDAINDKCRMGVSHIRHLLRSHYGAKVAPLLLITSRYQKKLFLRRRASVPFPASSRST